MLKFCCFLLFLTLFSCGLNKKRMDDKTWNEFAETIQSNPHSIYAVTDAQYLAQKHYDPAKRRLAQQWLDEMKKYKKGMVVRYNEQRKADQNFLYTHIGFLNTISDDISCNIEVKAIVVQPLTDNQDSLSKALRILTDSLFEKLPDGFDCHTAKSVTIYLFRLKKSIRKGETNNWFAMGQQDVRRGFEVKFQ